MLNITKCVLASLFVCHLVQAADGPFESRSFDEARMKAKEEGKLVFVDFYTTWCAPCKIMEKTTFADVGVVEWLKENTIALKVDAEKNVELANAYAINAYPTLIFTNADGTELGRMTGVQDPKPFLAEAAAIKAGKTPLVRAKEKLVAAGENDPMARMNYARSLVEMGKYEDALADFLWCFDQGNKHGIGFGGVRLSFLLSDIVRLGDKYPPALDALRQRRDTARERIRRQESKKRSFWQLFSTRADYFALDFSSLNECLGEEGETLKLYDEMRAEHPDWPVVGQLRDRAFDELLKAKRYTEIAESRDVDQWIERKTAMEKLGGMFLSKEDRQMIERLRRESLMREIGEYYEVLVGAKNGNAADKLSQYALKMDDGAETYNLLAWHGYVTGSPTKANLVQARKAYNLTKGQNAGIIDTLVRILDITDNKDEACDLLRTSVSDSFSEPDRKILAKCVVDLNCPESQ